MKTNFIKTSDLDTANKLKLNGFTEVSKEGEFYVFLNDGKQNFSEDDSKKMMYTNILNM